MIWAAPVLAAVVALCLAYDHRRRHPTRWTWTGPAPAGLEVALAVLVERGAPRGGSITWRSGPWESWGRVVSGELVSREPPRLVLEAYPQPERTALAHELAHLVFACGDPLPPVAVGWVADANAAIARRLGR